MAAEHQNSAALLDKQDRLLQIRKYARAKANYIWSFSRNIETDPQ